MPLYRCSRPGCQGHNTFSATCPPEVVLDYAPLHHFIELLETQPIKTIPNAPAEPAPAPTTKAKAYSNFWRE